MRPSIDKEVLVVLNKWNFDKWLKALKLLCIRRGAKSELEQYAWLVLTVKGTDKVMVEGYEKALPFSVEKDKPIEPSEKPFTWAVWLLRNSRLIKNAETEVELEQVYENAKDEIKGVKIKDFGFNLAEYFIRFDEKVKTANEIGVPISDGYIMTLFAKNCSEHKHLSARTGIVHLEKSATDYTSLMEIYRLLVPERDREPRRKASKSTPHGKQLMVLRYPSYDD